MNTETTRLNSYSNYQNNLTQTNSSTNNNNNGFFGKVFSYLKNCFSNVETNTDSNKDISTISIIKLEDEKYKVLNNEFIRTNNLKAKKIYDQKIYFLDDEPYLKLFDESIKTESANNSQFKAITISDIDNNSLFFESVIYKKIGFEQYDNEFKHSKDPVSTVIEIITRKNQEKEKNNFYVYGISSFDNEDVQKIVNLMKSLHDVNQSILIQLEQDDLEKISNFCKENNILGKSIPVMFNSLKTIFFYKLDH